MNTGDEDSTPAAAGVPSENGDALSREPLSAAPTGAAADGDPDSVSDDRRNAAALLLEARASDDAQIYQAGRDLHVHHGGVGIPLAHRAEMAGQGGSTEDSGCPYPGLAAFGREQARWFFGRDALVAELLTLLADQTGSGPVVLVASSGAGKSSLLRAGLIPALQRGALPEPGSRRWPHLTMVPGGAPLASLAEQLAQAVGIPSDLLEQQLATRPRDAVRRVAETLATQHPGSRIVLIVDQFEELFTLCRDQDERAAFVEALDALADASGPAGAPALVVLGLRADFYQQACEYPVLRAALQRNQLPMGPMSHDELRQAIVYPAQAVGLEMEPGLAELLVHDLGETNSDPSQISDTGALRRTVGTTYEAGRLPLLAHALRATWQQRSGHILTVSAYTSTGGIAHAIAATAERAYARLDDTGRQLSRALFLRLIVLGETADDTRRRVPARTLVEIADDAESVERLLDVYTAMRLLTRERDAVEISHEALLRAWPRLRDWADSDRERLLTAQAMEDAAQSWEQAGNDPSLLYRGLRLLGAVSHFAPTQQSGTAGTVQLSQRARRFLGASIRQRRRAARVRRVVISTLASLTLLAAMFAVGAGYLWRTALADKETAVFNQVTAEAGQQSGLNTTLGAELDALAYRIRPTEAGYTALLETEQQPMETRVDTGTNVSAESDDSGKTVAVDVNGEIQLWNTADAEHPVRVADPPMAFGADNMDVTISPDGRTLATEEQNGSVRLWDIADSVHPSVEGSTAPTSIGNTGAGMYFGRDDVLVVPTASTIRLWNVTKPAQPALISATSPCVNSSVDSAASDADWSSLAAGCTNGTVVLLTDLEAATPTVAATITASSDTAAVSAVAFDDAGDLLATSAQSDEQFQLWNTADPTHPAHLSTDSYGNNGITDLTFLPGKAEIASSDHNGSIELWNITSPATPYEVGEPMRADDGPVWGVQAITGGNEFIALYDTGLGLWQVPTSLTAVPPPSGADSPLAYSADGSLLARANSPQPGVTLYRTTAPAELRAATDAPAVCGTSAAVTLAFSPRSFLLAAGCQDGETELWNVAQPDSPVRLASFQMNADPICGLAFDGNGRRLAVADTSGEVEMFGLSDTASVQLEGSANYPVQGFVSIALNPAGTMLAIGGYNGTVYLGDVAGDGPAWSGLATLTSPQAQIDDIVFVPHTSLLAAGAADDDIYVWSVANPHHPALDGSPLSGDADAITDLAVSPDGRILVSTSNDQSVRLWNLAGPASPAQLGEPLYPNEEATFAVAFSPDDHTFAVLGNEGGLYLYDTGADYAIDRICANTGAIITPAQWAQFVPGEPYDPPCRSGQSQVPPA